MPVRRPEQVDATLQFTARELSRRQWKRGRKTMSSIADVADVATHPGRAGDADDLYSKITWRILPLLFVCYLFNYMDRTNIGFAQLQMKDQLAFSDAAFGFGAGVFSISHALSGSARQHAAGEMGPAPPRCGSCCCGGWPPPA